MSLIKKLYMIQAKREEAVEVDTLTRYSPSGPGQADNGVSEMVDLTGIYVVDNEMTHASEFDEYSAPNGSVHINGHEQLVSRTMLYLRMTFIAIKLPKIYSIKQLVVILMHARDQNFASICCSISVV